MPFKTVKIYERNLEKLALEIQERCDSLEENGWDVFSVMTTNGEISHGQNSGTIGAIIVAKQQVA